MIVPISDKGTERHQKRDDRRRFLSRVYAALFPVFRVTGETLVFITASTVRPHFFGLVKIFNRPFLSTVAGVLDKPSRLTPLSGLAVQARQASLHRLEPYSLARRYGYSAERA